MKAILTLFIFMLPIIAYSQYIWKNIELGKDKWETEMSVADSSDLAFFVDSANIVTRVYRTNNGGVTWDTIIESVRNKKTSKYEKYKDIAHPTQNTFFILADTMGLSFMDYIFNSVIRSVDNGKTWDTTFFKIDSGALSKIIMVDDKLGYIIGGPFWLFRTEDGGISWRQIEIPTDSLSDTGYYPTHNISIDNYYMNVSVPQYSNNSICILAKGWGKSRMLKSIDRGNTWSISMLLDTVIYSKFQGICFVDENIGWGVGSEDIPKSNRKLETIYKTEDGGLNWKLNYRGVLGDSAWGLYSVSFCDYLNGVCGNHNSVARTRDGGKSWQVQKTNVPIGYNFSQMHRVILKSPKHGYGCGPLGCLFIYNENSSSVREQTTNNISLYPNPAQNTINIHLADTVIPVASASNTDFNLIDNLSRKVLSKKIESGVNDFQIDVTNLPNGVYNAVIKNGEKIIIQKVVVTK